MRNYLQRVCIDFKSLVAGVLFQIQGGMVIFERDLSLMLLETEFWGTVMGTR